MKKKYIPYLLMLPIMIYTLLLIIYPLIFSAVLAFKKFDPISGLSLLNMKTVGWKNFSRNFGDNAFYESLFNTIEMVVIGVIVQFLFSFLLALALNKKTTITIVSDSKYVINGITKWLNGWKKNDWKNASNKPVKNVDLWQKLDELIRTHSVTFEWVKGHDGNVHNEKADYLARRYIEEA